MGEDVKGLYSALHNVGYTDKDTGDEEQFARLMADPKTRRKIYDNLAKGGRVDIGTYTEFEDKYGAPTNKTYQSARQVVEEGKNKAGASQPQGKPKEQTQPQPQPQSAQTQETHPQQQVQPKDRRALYEEAGWMDRWRKGENLSGEEESELEEYRKRHSPTDKTNEEILADYFNDKYKNNTEEELRERLIGSPAPNEVSPKGDKDNRGFWQRMIEDVANAFTKSKKEEKEEKDKEHSNASNDEKRRMNGDYTDEEEAALKEYRRANPGAWATKDSTILRQWDEQREVERKEEQEKAETEAFWKELEERPNEMGGYIPTKEEAEQLEQTAMEARQVANLTKKNAKDIKERSERFQENPLRTPKLQYNFVTGKPEQVYTTKLGNETTDLRQVQKDSDLADEIFGKTWSEQADELGNRISAVRNEAAEAAKQRQEQVPYAIRMQGSQFGRTGDWDNAMDPDAQAARFAQYHLDKAKQIQKVGEDYKRDNWKSNFFVGAGRGFIDSSFDSRTWDFGLQDLAESKMLKDAVEKDEKGEKLTEAESALLDAISLEMAINAEYSAYIGRGYKAGQVTGESLPFMLEMLANPASGIGEATAKKLAGSVMKRYGKQLLENIGKNATRRVLTASAIAGREIGNVAGAAIMTNTTGLAQTMADMNNRMIGDIQYEGGDARATSRLVYNPDGSVDTEQIDGGKRSKIAYSHTENKKDFGRALWEAEASQAIERWSEFQGENIAPFLKASGGLTKKGLEKIGLSGVNDWIEKMSASDFSQGMSRFLQRTQWHGVGGEFSEEIIGGIANALLVGDQTLDTDPQTGVFNLDNMIDTFLGVGLQGGFMSAINTVGYSRERLRVGAQIAKAESTTAALWGSDKEKQFDKFLDALDGTADEAKKAVKGIIGDPSLTLAQKEAALNLAGMKMKERGMEKAHENLMRTRDDINTRVWREMQAASANGARLVNPNLQTDEDGELKFRDGDEEQQEETARGETDVAGVRNAYARDNYMRSEIQTLDPSGELLRRLDENPQKAMQELRFSGANPAVLQICMDYIQANATMSGVVSEFANQTSADIIAERNSLRDRAQKDGKIHHATLKSGERVAIKSEDQNSAIVIGENGEPRMIPTSDIAERGEEEDVQGRINTASEQIKNNASAGLQEILTPTLPFNQGDEYNIVLPDGSRGNVTIIGSAMNEDGTPIEDTVIVRNPDGTESLEKTEYIQQQSDEAYMQDIATNVTEERKRQLEALMPKQEEASEAKEAPAEEKEGARERKVGDKGRALFRQGEEVTIKEYEITGINDDGTFRIKFSDSDNELGLKPDILDSMEEEVKKWENEQGAQSEAEGGTEASTEQPQQRVYEQGGEVRLIDDNGNTITGTITQVRPDGTFIVETETPVGGVTVNNFSAQQLDDIQNNIKDEEEAQEAAEESSDADGQEEQPQVSALSKIPVDESGNPDFEKASNLRDVVDAIIEMTNGDTNIATKSINAYLDKAKGDAKKARKDADNPQAGANMAETIANANAAEQVAKQAQQRVDFWQSVANEMKQKIEEDKEKARIQQEAEAKRKAAEAEEKRKKEEAEQAAKRAAEAQSQGLSDVPEMDEDRDEDAQARGFHRYNGKKVLRQEAKDVKKILGKEVNVKFSNDTKQAGHVALVEASQLQPSHLSDGQRNPAHFIGDAQPKEDDQTRRTGRQDMRKNLNLEEITGSITAFMGAPSVNARGEVIQGNNRALALKEIMSFEPKQAERYKQYLKDHASEFGLTPEQIDSMENPILVNLLDVNDEEARILGAFVSTDTETGGVERIKAKNARQKMGDDISRFAQKLMESGDEELSFSESMDKNAADVLKWMRDKGYISPTQYTSAFDASGDVTGEAKNDLRDILYECVFEGANPALKTKFKKLPAKAQKAILATMWRDSSSPVSERMVREVQRAIDLYYQLQQRESFQKAKGEQQVRGAVREWLAQTQFDEETGETYLPSKKFSNFAIELATTFKANTQKEMESLFNRIYDLIQGRAQGDLFDDDLGQLSLKEAVEKVLNIEYDGENGSDNVAGGDATGTRGEQSNAGETASGEQSAQGEQSTERAGGTEGTTEQIEGAQSQAENAQNPQENQAKETNEQENSATSQQEEQVEQPLTVEEVENSDLDQSFKDLAIDYINGNKNATSEAAYQLALDYVRNQSRNRSGDSENADEALVGGTTNETAGGESGQGGGNGAQVDNADNGERGSAGVRGETGEGSVAQPTGGNGNRKVSEQKPGKKSSTRNGADSGVRSESGGEGGNGGTAVGAAGGGNESGGGLPSENGGRQGEAESRPDYDKLISDEISNIIDSLTHPLRMPWGGGKLFTTIPIVTQLGANGIRILSSAAKIGHALVMKGYYRFKDWKAQMNNNLYPVFKQHTQLSDADIDRLIVDMWDCSVTAGGQRKLVREWAKELELAELRKVMQMSIKEKAELQKKAEGIKNIHGDIDNIRESLPFLLPAQQEDVQKAEVQFFDPSHSDREHGNGKGYMFTNGTGTGKTYTGAGIIKRFIKEGKKRILIVTASDVKINDWIKDVANLGIPATQLKDTKDKGKGVVVTQYANMAQNYELLKDDFDLIVYDESHKLQESKDGKPTARAVMHHMLSNRDVEQAILRKLQNTEPWVRGRAIDEEIKSLERLVSDFSVNQTAKLKAEIDRLGGVEGIEKKINELNGEKKLLGEQQDEEIEKALNDKQQVEEAQKAVDKTKVVFLSATPFNTPMSLDYVEGYIFSYPEEEKKDNKEEENTEGAQLIKKSDKGERRKRQSTFVMKNFGSSHVRNRSGEVERLDETRITDPDAASDEELSFSTHLQEDLNTMSGRPLDSAFDYSREFPKVDFPQAEIFNSAVSELSTGKFAAIGKYFKSLLGDYNTQTALFEIIKTGPSIERAKEHLKHGRKVVIFHRRVDSKKPIEPPFEAGLKAVMMSGEKPEKDLAVQFGFKYRELLSWEQGLNYNFPHEQIMNAFATDKEKEDFWKKTEEWVKKGMKGKQPRLVAAAVGAINGQETDSRKKAVVNAFNDDNSGMDVIVVQIQSGKEGISLHDTTGKKQRAQICISLPQSPIEFIQAEGRIYRVGNKSNAIFEYPMLGVDLELYSFAGKINGRSQTSENLALGSEARGLRESISRAALSSRKIPVTADMGTGGKALDDASLQKKTGYDDALNNYGEWASESQANERFAARDVPDPIGFKMAEWGMPENGETVLVANAGNGTVARYVSGRSKLVATEASTGKVARLTALVGGSGKRIENVNFADFNMRGKSDVVICKAEQFGDALSHISDCGRFVVLAKESELMGMGKVKQIMEGFGDAKRLSAEIILPACAMESDGEKTHILVYDVRTAYQKKYAKTETQVYDLSDIDDANKLYSALRDVTVPKREIDVASRIRKKMEKHANKLEKSSIVEKTKNWSTNKMEPEVRNGQDGFRVFFRSRTIGVPAVSSSSNAFWRSFEIDYNLIADNDTDYLISLARAWVRMQDEKPYVYDSLKEGEQVAQETYKILSDMIMDALGKNEMQIRNLANGMAENKVSGVMNMRQFRQAFDALNADSAVITELADKVFAAAEKIDGMEIKVVPQSDMPGGSSSVVGCYRVAGGKSYLLLNERAFNSAKIADSFKAQTLIHEMIHAVTSYYIDSYKNGDTSWMTEGQKQACKDIMDVFKIISADNNFRSSLRLNSKLSDNAEYGLTSEDEMMAELANPVFRATLKAKNLWRQLINGIKKLIGMDVTEEENTQTNALNVLEEALDELMNGYNGDAYKRYEAQTLRTTTDKFNKSEYAAERARLNEIDEEMEQAKDARDIFRQARLVAERDGIERARRQREDREIHPIKEKKEEQEKQKQQANNRAQQISDEANTRVEANRQREMNPQMRQKLNAVAGNLNLANVDILENGDGLTGRRKKAKGWYDPRTGRITIVLGNNKSMEDALQTLLHEAVAHHGLRQLFGERFDDFLKQVYQSTDAATLAQINEMARKNGWDFRTATEEYLAKLAEDTDFESAEYSGMWPKIKNFFTNLLRDMGFDVEMSENEMRYALWRSYQNLKEGKHDTILSEATDKAVENRLNVGNDAIDPNSPEVLYRDGDNDVARIRNEYERKMKSGWFQSVEAIQDSMQSLWEFNKLALGKAWKGIKNIPDYMNAYFGENRLSSVNEQEAKEYSRRLFQPMYEEVRKLARNARQRQTLNRYMMSKHGLERNLYMAEREARKAWEEQRAKAEKKQSSEAPKEWEDRQYKVGDTVKSYGNEEEGEGLYEWKIVSQNEDGTFNLERDGWTWSGATEAGLNGQEREVRDKEIEEWRNANRSSLAWDELTDEEREQLTTPFRRDYAGLTDLFGLGKDDWQEAEQRAQQLVVDYEQAKDTAPLWEKVKAVSDAILKKQLDTGVISKATYDKVRGMYKNYIPLRGFEEDTADDVYAYLNQQASPFNNPIQTAKGRTSQADDPFVNLESMAESAILHGNRNQLVKQAFYNFVNTHPTDLVTRSQLWLRKNEDGVWEAVFCDTLLDSDTPEQVTRKLAEFEESMQRAKEEHPEDYRHGREVADIPYRMPRQGALPEHQIVVKVNGKDIVLTVNGNPRLAQAVNGRTNPDAANSGAIGAMLNSIGTINRALSQVYTTWNPDFIMSNFVRDMIYSNTMAWVKENPAYAARFNANCARCNPLHMLSLIDRQRRGTLKGDSQMDRYFDEFMKNGGETGYARMRDVDKIRGDIEKQLRVGAKSLPGVVSGQIAELAGELGRSVEMAARFAAFVTSREMGREVGRSIYDAKEISVNFNKKGAGDRFMNATGQTGWGRFFAGVSGFGRSFYVFWNAGVQGLTNVISASRENKGKATVAASALLMLGLTNALRAGGGGDGDDDEEGKGDSYWDIPEYVRRSNFVFRGKGNNWIKLPLPIEFRAIYGTAETLATFLKGKESREDALWDIAGCLSQVMPIDMLEGQQPGSFSLTQSLMPSLVKPVWEIHENRSWTGRPIQKQTTDYNKYLPEWQKAFPSTGRFVVDVTKMLNEWTGGDDFTRGDINMSPAFIQYAMRQYGPFYTLGNELVNTASVIRGNKEFDWRYIPLANRVVMSGGEQMRESSATQQYFKNKDKYDELLYRFGQYTKDPQKYADKINEIVNSQDFIDAQIFRRFGNSISNVNKGINNPTVDEETKKSLRRIRSTLQTDATEMTASD